MQKASIILVDNRTLVREGLRQLLHQEPLAVVETSPDLGALAEMLAAEDIAADVVLFDFTPEIASEDWREAIRRLRSLRPSLRVVALCDVLCVERVIAALHVGIDGFLLKDISPSALRQSIQLVMLGEKVFPTDLVSWVATHAPDYAHHDEAILPGDSGLSGREVEILRRLMLGNSNKVIANELNITEGTVKVHLKGILKKINVRNRTQAAVWALNNGLGARRAPAPALQPGRDCPSPNGEQPVGIGMPRPPERALDRA